MSAFTENQATIFRLKASGENYFSKFTHYNNYLSITYIIPQNKFLGLKAPIWTIVKSIVLFENNYIIEVGLYNDANLYDIETALKHPLVTFK